MVQIRLGQALLIVCCVFYLIWWSVAFHPSHGNVHASGITMVLLLITFIFGIAGMSVNLIGIRDHANERGFISGYAIIVCGILSYFILMYGTRILLNRQVTTELFLIIGWTMLEVASANSVFSLGRMSVREVVFFLIIVAVAVVSSLIFYLAYYRVEPMLAYYFGMIPLVTEAMCMGVFLFLTK